MKRTKFTIAGQHPLLFEIRRHLIVDKLMQLVEPGDSPDFAVVGAAKSDPGPSDTIGLLGEVSCISPGTPVLLLSSSDVYSDRDDMGMVSENKPMSEGRATVIPSPMDPRAPSALFSLTAETHVLGSFSHVLVLRTFEVYGPSLGGTIQQLRRQAKCGEALSIEAPGYQTRTFLHLDDFLVAFDRLVPKFLKGVRGIYNIGSSEEVSLKRLADSIWQLTNPGGGDTPLEPVQPKGLQVWWVAPDITRIQVLLGWKPAITLRKGLWTIINEEQ